MSEKVGIQGHTAAISFDGKPTEKELAYSKGFKDGLIHSAAIAQRASCWSDDAAEEISMDILREVK